jgi:methylamine dehydrogenase accessory protein MauD
LIGYHRSSFYVLFGRKTGMENVLLVSSLLLWIVVLLNLVLTLALIRRVNTIGGRSTPDVKVGPPAGEKAPDFQANTLTGETVALSAYAGHPTTFVFLAPGCGPCRELLPSLKALAPQAREAGAELVLVSDGTLEATRALGKEMEQDLPVLVAPRKENAFFDAYQITMTPSYCSLDEQGMVLEAGYPSPQSQQWQTLTTGWSQRAAVL